jgi:LmbE family N-acetylglucosaminyl deacetylase
MTASWLDVLSALPGAPPPPAGRVVVVSAHPDDEVLGIGAWLAGLTDRDVVFVTVTDGEASHPGSPTTTREQLRERRPPELLAALRRLGFVHPQVLRLRIPDGRVAEHRAALEAELARVVAGCGLVLAPFEHDGHPDHEAVGAAALAVAGATPVWRFPIWTRAWTRPDHQAWLDRAHRLPDLPGAWALKEAAVHEFVTQVRPLGDDPADAAVVGDDLLSEVLQGPEVVIA